MALKRKTSTRRRPTAATASRPKNEARHALLVIDHARANRAAWAEFHTVRKRLDKAARELHRHEEIDTPAYEAWLHRTFPLQVTALRELQEEVVAKARKIQRVQARAAHTGRSLKRLWQEQKERDANPEAFREEFRVPRDEAFEKEEFSERRKEARPEDFERAATPPRSGAAREIFRRLVQRLHPDRGGAWTAARQRLWHEVQKAWAQGDSDWLARLEVEWETAHETLSVQSPLSRIRAAIEELHAARRDIEHKLSTYRESRAWRFTKSEAKRAALERRVEADLAHDFRVLRRQLNHLDKTIAAWEEDWTREKTRPAKPGPAAGFPRRGRRNSAGNSNFGKRNRE